MEKNRNIYFFKKCFTIHYIYIYFLIPGYIKMKKKDRAPVFVEFTVY